MTVAQTDYAAMSSADLYAEACAAAWIGFGYDDAVTERLGVSSATGMLEALLDRTDLTAEAKLKAMRMQLKVHYLSGRLDEAQEAIENLPETFEGLSQEQWDRQKLLWKLGARGRIQGQWAEVRSALDALPAEPAQTGVLRANIEALKCLAMIYSGDAEAGYKALADATVNCSAWEPDDPGFDPFFGTFALFDLHDWSTLKGVLKTLDEQGGDSVVALRRWLEIASPPYNPMVRKFPEASGAERALLDETFQAKRQALVKDPQVAEPPTGGFREILSHHQRVNDYIAVDRGRAALAYIDNLPADVKGIPDQLWNAYKKGWQTMAWFRTLSSGRINQEADAIEAALAILPARPFASRCWPAVGFAKMNRFNADAFTAYAKGLSSPPYVSVMSKSIRKNLLKSVPALSLAQVGSILAILDSAPDLPQVQVTRAAFTIHHASKFDETTRAEKLEQALTEAVTALDKLERGHDPIQTGLRSEIEPYLAKAVESLSGEEAKSRLLADYGKPVRENSELRLYLPEESLAQDVIIELASTQKSPFRAMVDTLGEDAVDEARRIASGLTHDQLRECVDSIEGRMTSRQSLGAAKALLDEAVLRGREVCGFTPVQWLMVETRRSEFQLGSEATHEFALETLRVTSADTTFSSDPIGEDARSKAALIVDACETMQTREAYLWAIDWMKQIETSDLVGMGYLRDILAQPLKGAFERPDIQAYLDGPESDARARWNHSYLLGYALTYAGDYSGAEDVYDTILTSTEVAPYTRGHVRAGQWRNFVWHKQYLEAADDEIKLALCRKIVDYTLAYYTGLENDEYREGFARWAVWAATQLNDEAAIDVFNAVLGH